MAAPVRGELNQFIAAATGSAPSLDAPLVAEARSALERGGEWQEAPVLKVALHVLEEAAHGKPENDPSAEAAARLRSRLVEEYPDDLRVRLDAIAHAGAPTARTVDELERALSGTRLGFDRSVLYDDWRKRLDGAVASGYTRPLAASVAWTGTTGNPLPAYLSHVESAKASWNEPVLRRLSRALVSLARLEEQGTRVQDLTDAWDDLSVAYALAPSADVGTELRTLHRDLPALAEGEVVDLMWLKALPIRPLRDELFDTEMQNEIGLIRRLTAGSKLFAVREPGDQDYWARIFPLPHDLAGPGSSVPQPENPLRKAPKTSR
ncbi:MAG: hypothetical protein ACYDCL_23940 [Myxococcales bacterium]